MPPWRLPLRSPNRSIWLWPMRRSPPRKRNPLRPLSLLLRRRPKGTSPLKRSRTVTKARSSHLARRSAVGVAADRACSVDLPEESRFVAVASAG